MIWATRRACTAPPVDQVARTRWRRARVAATVVVLQRIGAPFSSAPPPGDCGEQLAGCRARTPRRPRPIVDERRRSTRRTRAGRTGSWWCRRSDRSASELPTLPAASVPSSPIDGIVGSFAARKPVDDQRSDGAVELGDDVGVGRLGVDAEVTPCFRPSRTRSPAATARRDARSQQFAVRRSVTIVASLFSRRSISCHSPRARSTSTATMLIPRAATIGAEERAQALAAWRTSRGTAA